MNSKDFEKLSLEEKKQLIRTHLSKQAWEVAKRWAPVYKALGWTWSGTGETIVPDSIDLEGTIRSLIRMVFDVPESSLDNQASTGGIMVYFNLANPYSNPNGICGITFTDQLAEWGKNL